ncbi:MAG: MoaD/ThiS family protein, partial [Pseudomonadota bacterium]
PNGRGKEAKRMTVKIHIPPFLRHFTDELTSVDVAGATVGECLTHLMRHFPSFEKRLFLGPGNLIHSVDIYVNRESAYPEELSKPVRDGDELHIVLVLAGG